MHTIAFLGFTLDVAGKLIIAYTAIKVHYRVWQEHKIDEKVFREMRRERMWGILGLIMIAAGYVLQVPSKI
jgi:hypothetical protein